MTPPLSYRTQAATGLPLFAFAFLFVVVVSVLLASCGYRPVASVAETTELGAVSVPTFRSYIAAPQMDVAAASTLADRLQAYGFDIKPTSQSEMQVEGMILAVEELPLALGNGIDGANVVELRVLLQAELTSGQIRCLTPVVEGFSQFAVPLGVSSEIEWQRALLAAIADGIDGLGIEIVACLPAMAPANQPAPPDASVDPAGEN